MRMRAIYKSFKYTSLDVASLDAPEVAPGLKNLQLSYTAECMTDEEPDLTPIRKDDKEVEMESGRGEGGSKH